MMTGTLVCPFCGGETRSDDGETGYCHTCTEVVALECETDEEGSDDD